MNCQALICGAVFAAGFATTGAAETYSDFGTAEGWNVFVDHEQNSCLIERTEGDIHVQMGLTKGKDFAYIGVFTKGDSGLEPGNMGDFVFYLDEDTFHGDVTAFKTRAPEGYSGAYMLANNPNFISDVSSKNTFKAVNKDRIFEMSLHGAKEAIEMARECVAAQQ